MTLLRGRKGGLVDLGSGDGRIVSIKKIVLCLLFKPVKNVLLTVVIFNPNRSWKPTGRASLLLLGMNSTPGSYACPAFMHGEQAIMKKYHTSGKICGRFDICHLLWTYITPEVTPDSVICLIASEVLLLSKKRDTIQTLHLNSLQFRYLDGPSARRLKMTYNAFGLFIACH